MRCRHPIFLLLFAQKLKSFDEKTDIPTRGPGFSPKRFFLPFSCKKSNFQFKIPSSRCQKYNRVVFFRDFEGVFWVFKEVDKSLDTIPLFYSMIFQSSKKGANHWCISVFPRFFPRQCL